MNTMKNNFKKFSFFILFLIFFINAEAQETTDIDPGGLVTYQLGYSSYVKYEKGDREKLKQNKVKEVYVNGDTNFAAEKMIFDREGRMIENTYYHFNKGTSHVYTSYDSLGRGRQYSNQIEGKQRFELNIFYGEYFPEYMIASGDSTKPVRYDINYKSGKPKSFVNNNYKDGTLSFTFEYSGISTRINMDINSYSSKLFEIISTSDSLVYSVGTFKIISRYNSEGLKQIITERNSELVSDEVYYRKPTGIIDFAVKTREGCLPLKCEFEYTYYED